VELNVLGPLELRTSRVTGGPLAAVRLGPPKQRAVLALLAMHADRVVPTDLIVEAPLHGRDRGRARLLAEVARTHTAHG